jgi:uncharacterized protein
VTELLGGLTPERWDELARDHFYSSSGWLGLCARTPGPRCTAATVRLPDGTSAAVPVAVVDSPLTGNYDWNRPLTDRGLPLLPGTGLLVGPSLGYQTHLLTAGHGRPAVEALLGEVRQLARATALDPDPACVAMYLSTVDVQALLDAGVTAPPVLLEPDAWFEVPDGGWEPWLATLRTTCRERVRRDVRRFDAMGYKVWHDALPNCYERLPPLAVELAKKTGFDPTPARFEAEFSRYVEATGDAAKVVLCEDGDGTLMGFCIYYLWGGTIYLRWGAFNYPKLSGGSAEYFNICYYNQVRLAGEVGAHRLHAGKKVIDAKVLRGARLRPLWMLDLSERSPLAAHAGQVRGHNARLLHELATASVTAKALADRAEWEVFC